MTRPKKDQAPYIEKVEKLPHSALRRQDKAYTDILQMIEKADFGLYKIHIPNKKPATIYNVLRKRVKSQHIPNLTIILRQQQVYIQKVQCAEDLVAKLDSVKET